MVDTYFFIHPSLIYSTSTFPKFVKAPQHMFEHNPYLLIASGVKYRYQAFQWHIRLPFFPFLISHIFVVHMCFGCLYIHIYIYRERIQTYLFPTSVWGIIYLLNVGRAPLFLPYAHAGKASLRRLLANSSNGVDGKWWGVVAGGVLPSTSSELRPDLALPSESGLGCGGG